jgi:prolyl 4-hydroxylase
MAPDPQPSAPANPAAASSWEANAPRRGVAEISPDMFWFEGLLSPGLCEHLIGIADLQAPPRAGIELGRRDGSVRNSSQLRLEGSELLDSTHQLLLERLGVIQAWLKGHYGIAFTQAEACSILRYDPGEYYKRHVDNLLMPSRMHEAAQGIPTRDVSIVGYLNEGFEGGETYFDRQELKVVPQAGGVIVFPSFFAFPHQSLPVVSGRKYAWVSWLYF